MNKNGRHRAPIEGVLILKKETERGGRQNSVLRIELEGSSALAQIYQGARFSVNSSADRDRAGGYFEIQLTLIDRVQVEVVRSPRYSRARSQLFEAAGNAVYQRSPFSFLNLDNYRGQITALQVAVRIDGHYRPVQAVKNSYQIFDPGSA